MSAIIETRVGGWIHGNGTDKRRLLQSAEPLMRSMQDRAYLDDQPLEVFPDWIDIFNQGPVGSCAGAARAYLAMMIFEKQFGVKLRFSTMHAYLGAQQIDGIRGDRGSTIEGQMKHWMRDGLCLDATFPYPGRYVSNFPQAAAVEGKHFKLSGYSISQSAQEDLENIQLGLGADYGINWTRMIDEQAKRNRGVIEEWSGEGRGGGHSVAGVGCVLPSTVYEVTGHKPKYDGWYIMILNSWGDDDTGVVGTSQTPADELILEWGFKGYSFWSMKAIESIHRHRWSVVALPQAMVVSDEKQNQYRPNYDL